MKVVNIRRVADPASKSGLDLSWGAGGRIQAALDDLTDSSSLPATEAVRDLVAFAVAAYTADKAVLRSETADKWTRSIELRVPLTAPAAWPVAASESLLHRLTGDNWRVKPRQSRGPLNLWAAVQMSTTAESPSSETALLSGGLDSLSYLAQVSGASRRIDFVAHYDPNAHKSRQRALFEGMVADGSPLKLHQFNAKLVKPSDTDRSTLEDTTRARAALFVAGAVAVAAMNDCDVVSIPENGFVSINLPLGPNRIGALTTRTTHPLTIALFQELLNELGLGVVLDTPYAYMTKGEVVRAGRAAGLSDSLAKESISCARPNQGRWDKIPYGNCGYCYACLIRRASLDASGGDPTKYRLDPRADVDVALHKKRGVDFRAVVTALSRPLRASSVVAAGPVPSSYDVDRAFDMLRRSQLELREMIRNGLSSKVRATIGW